eukprot:TRINITY_DN3131_c0_g1_i1.p1 TRINITY_DN3131_c0_g1~~TRINITY_DN3131_c0_g1_i1.p1  ORF type:complete len:883 (+),score=156.58 TRINITY_DN3131_c0_g1_i1:111-2759(+)
MGRFDMTVPAGELELERQTRMLAPRVDIANFQAKEKCPEVDATPQQPLGDLNVGVISTGATNTGKTSMNNTMLCGTANVPCSTSITAETIHCTEIRIADKFTVDGVSAQDMDQFCELLHQAQRRPPRGEEIPPSRTIAVTVPVVPELLFNLGEHATLVDTPGISEELSDREAPKLEATVKECISRHSPKAVLLYCLPIDKGISISGGTALMHNDKDFLRTCGVPLHRVIILATKYDLLVDAQKSDEGRRMGFRAPPPLDANEKCRKAEQVFQIIREQVAQELPGAQLMPCASIHPNDLAQHSACDMSQRLKMVFDIFQAAQSCLILARRDAELAHCRTLAECINRNILAARTRTDSFDQERCLERCNEEAMRIMGKFPDRLDNILGRCQQDIGRNYALEGGYATALLNASCDPVHFATLELIRDAQVAAITIVGDELADSLDQASPAGGPNGFRGMNAEGLGGAGDVATGLHFAACGLAAIGVSFVAEVGLASVAGPVGLAIGGTLATVVGIGRVCKALNWTYDGTKAKVRDMYLARFERVKSGFSDALRGELVAISQGALATVEADASEVGRRLRPVGELIVKHMNVLRMPPGQRVCSADAREAIIGAHGTGARVVVREGTAPASPAQQPRRSGCPAESAPAPALQPLRRSGPAEPAPAPELSFSRAEAGARCRGLRMGSNVRLSSERLHCGALPPPELLRPGEIAVVYGVDEQVGTVTLLHKDRMVHVRRDLLELVEADESAAGKSPDQDFDEARSRPAVHDSLHEAAAAQNGSALPPTLRQDCTVVMHGLRCAPELNGTKAVVLRTRDDGQVVVSFEVQKVLKMDNLVALKEEPKAGGSECTAENCDACGRKLPPRRTCAACMEEMCAAARRASAVAEP